MKKEETSKTTEQKPKKKTTSKKKLEVVPIDFEATTEQARKATAKQFTNSTFKKPTGDYYKLDLVVRDNVYVGNKPKMVETIKTDYKSYLKTMAKHEDLSITKYLHKLIDADMKKKKKLYEELKK